VERKVRRTTLSAITFAGQVASQTGGAYDILVIGEGADAASAEVAQFGARQVFKTEIGGGYLCERYAPTVVGLVKERGYQVVTATASTFGKDLKPRLAARLGAGFASDIAEVLVKDGKLSYRRAMYAGNVFGFLEIQTGVQVVTVRQS